jgi:N-methylhydantoinase A
MRYAGQSFELSVPFSGDVLEAFHDAHERAYGYALRERAVEVVNVRVEAVGQVEKPMFEAEALAVDVGAQRAAPLRVKGDVAVYAREALQPGAQLGGAALIVQLDSTVYVAPRWTAFVDGYRNLILEYA